MALRNYLYAKHADGVTAARINKVDPNDSRTELIQQTIESFNNHNRQLNTHHTSPNHRNKSPDHNNSKKKKIRVVHGPSQSRMKKTNMQFYKSNESLNEVESVPSSFSEGTVTKSKCHRNSDNIEMEDAPTEKCKNCPDCESKKHKHEDDEEGTSSPTSPLLAEQTVPKVAVEYHNSDYTTMAQLQSQITSLSLDNSSSNEIDFTHVL
ncbi:uncharacterized protein RJT21DRAFT_18675 [Scheffersomyces amazonensis]|uniref:uncharacterized protein n=1 Tax=Scheffersomyces amazonensis TaxID=1078765 RepID=UPI00315DB848